MGRIVPALDGRFQLNRPTGISPTRLVRMERPAPIRSSWVTLRELESTHRRATCEGAGHEQRTIYRSRCPRGNDCGRGGGTRWGGTVVGRDPQPNRIDSQAGEEARTGQALARVL